jgi:hypothetical protein
MRTSSTRQETPGARLLEEVDGGGKGLHVKPHRADQAAQGFAHRQVVIDDENGFCPVFNRSPLPRDQIDGMLKTKRAPDSTDVEPQAPAMIFDDGPADRQPHAQPVLLGREEGVEQLFLAWGGMPGPQSCTEKTAPSAASSFTSR